MTMATPSASSVSKKTILKRKLDDSVLKKARAALGLPLEGADGDDDKQDEPSLKWRKPRHNTAEGQLYVKNKEKRMKMEGDQVKKPPIKTIKNLKTGSSTSTKVEKETKKKRKKKKKKKASTTPVESKERNQDSEKRHVMEAISYLQLWASNRDHWKFEKLKQTCLLKYCLNTDLIDDTRFETLLEYIVSIKGAARQATLTEMQSVVTKFEVAGGNASTEITDVMYDRARQIIQMLSDD
ncbi:unnamed protein product [Orchesella dallaii]|uniref:WKF domain-containing protein n=1 Tax=Orchesella dallaii TaxID=48710 RepID=A0ABP1QAM4_9HEXA